MKNFYVFMFLMLFVITLPLQSKNLKIQSVEHVSLIKDVGYGVSYFFKNRDMIVLNSKRMVLKVFYHDKIKNELYLMDDEVREIVVLKIDGNKISNLITTYECPYLGYDIKNMDGLFVSGYRNDFWVYEIKREKTFLPSHIKYGLDNHNIYREKYFDTQELPAVGIKGYFDVADGNIFYIWEGDLKIIQIDIKTNFISSFPCNKTKYYTQPNGKDISGFYKNRNFEQAFKKQKEYSYVKKISVNQEFVFVVYDTGGVRKEYRLQIYSLNGQFKDDVFICKNNNIIGIHFNKEQNEMYALKKINNEIVIFSFSLVQK